MKILLSSALVTATLLAGYAMAGEPPRTDSNGGGGRDLMRADTDHDGRISRAEAEAASAERSNGWFDKLDLNKDGYITQDELRQARETRMAGMKAKMDERFKDADTNGDGQLSLDEVQAKMPRLASRFQALDTDKNGALSREELAQGHRGPRGPAPQN